MSIDAEGPRGPQTSTTLAGPTAVEPRVFGDFEVVEELARGGMGVVYKARQRGLNRIVALKMILGGRFASAADVQRFRAEARSIAALEHPNIVPIYEVGEQDGHHYFGMKLIEGTTLAKMAASFFDDPRGAARLMALVARAVHHAHQHGILHRDLKPANILIDREGRPYVADFGVAKPSQHDGAITDAGAVVGTPDYMSPEQAAGRPATTLSDVHALGAMLYELLAGRPPFSGDTIWQTLQRVQEDRPAHPSRFNARAPADLCAIALTCLEKDSAKRYESAGDLAGDLDRWLAGEPTRARPASLAQQAWMWLRRNVHAAALVAILGVGVGLLGPQLVAFNSLGALIRSGGASYAKNFPSEPLPWLYRLPVPPEWAVVPMYIVGTAVTLFAGLIVFLIVRPKDRWSDATAGGAIGLIAGIIDLGFMTGPALVVAFTTLASLTDIQLLSDLATSPIDTTAQSRKASEAILDRYPDLRSVAESSRPAIVASKILADEISGAFRGLAKAMSILCLVFVPAGICSAMAAGHVMRRRNRLTFMNVVRYLELSIGATAAVVGVIAAQTLSVAAPAAGTAIPMAVLGLLLIEVIRRDWSGPVRLAAYAVWLFGLWSLSASWRPDMMVRSWALGGFVASCAAFAIVWRMYRIRT